MNHKNITMIIIAVLIASISAGLILSDNSEANITMGDISSSDFTTNKDGTITILMSNDEERVVSVNITASNPDTGAIYKTTKVDIPKDTKDYAAKISFNIDEVGQYNVKIVCESDADFQGDIYEKTTIVDVTESIWSNWVTYGAIIVVVILIAIAVALKLRSAPTVKPETTFTQIESERGSGDVLTNVPASSVERKKYRSAEPESKPKETTPVKESKHSFTGLSKQKTEPAKESKPSFTELSKQQAEPKKKEEPGSEPKKLKYVSSRRK